MERAVVVLPVERVVVVLSVEDVSVVLSGEIVVVLPVDVMVEASVVVEPVE